MEAAASIVGLLAIAAKVGLALENFVSNCIDAPLIAQTICDEVRDFRFALSKLQPYVDRTTPITPLGALSTDVNHLSLTLVSCVSTLARLEKTVDRLKTSGRMDTVDRLRWSWAEAAIAELAQRLQHHKSTLNLLLTIWISESCAQVEECTDRLSDQLAAGFPQGGQSQNTPASGALNTIAGMSLSSSSIPTGGTGSLRSYRRAFEPSLYTSRPYRNITNSSMISLTSSQRLGTRWSLFSGGSNTSVFSLPITTFTLSGQSLKEVQNISSIALPVPLGSVYNPWWYTTGRLPLTPALRIGIGSDLNRILLAAGEAGDWETVLRALAAGADIESSEASLRGTVLHMAVGGKAQEIVRVLLDRGASIEALDSNHNTPLHYGCQTGHEVIVQLLLDRGANLKARNKAGGEPIHSAAIGGQAVIAGRLLDRGASIESRDQRTRTPLHRAAMHGHVVTISLLLDRGANVDANNASNDTPLLLAARRNPKDAAVVELLLSRGADPDPTRRGKSSLLHWAVIYDHLTTVSLLLDLGADIDRTDASNNTPLLLAARGYSTHTAMVTLLLRRGANPNPTYQDNSTLLHWAAAYGYTETALLILGFGANIETQDWRGYTPLHVACLEGHRDMVSQLLCEGADTEARTTRGYTPLYLLVEDGYWHGERAGIVELLLEQGALAQIGDI